MLGKIQELDVLTFLLAVTVKVPIQVGPMFLAGFTLSATVFLATFNILPLVMAGMP
jgi:hypothetical protein